MLVKFVRRKATFLTDMSVTISSEHLMQNQLLSKFTEYAYTIATDGVFVLLLPIHWYTDTNLCHLWRKS